MVEKKRIKKIFELLKENYPETKPQLNFNNPFELLIATILSAQCTDNRVNIVTKELFKKYKRPTDYYKVSHEELASDIFSTGFYNSKAKNIQECCKILDDKFNGEVPQDFDLLVELPGVGRKTASVVAGNAFGIPAIAVDTHVKRITNLLKIVESNDPVKIELELKTKLEKEHWVHMTFWFIMHGRKVCIANRPKCDICILKDLCPSKR